jgi:hypothetical protein
MPASPDRILSDRYRPDRTGLRLPPSPYEIQVTRLKTSLEPLMQESKPWKAGIVNPDRQEYYPLETNIELDSLPLNVKNFLSAMGSWVNGDMSVAVIYQLCQEGEGKEDFHNFDLILPAAEEEAIECIHIQPDNNELRLPRGSFADEGKKFIRPLLKVVDLHDRRGQLVESLHLTGKPAADRDRIQALRAAQTLRTAENSTQAAFLEELLSIVNRTF